jgi:uncharacterized membrane protein YphA (DoxX/SURF4 family)
MIDKEFFMATLAHGAHDMKEMSALNIAIWVGEVILMGVFGYTGYMKTFMPISDLSMSMAWTGEVPATLVRFIGICEMAGALGLILPPVIKFLPGILTPMASMGLMTIMLLAMGFHSMRGEMQALPINIVLGSIALFVSWGRYKKNPVHPKT